MASDIVTATRRDPLGELRHDRDRFVALAFSSADLLFELDRDGRVVFAAGAVGALIGEALAVATTGQRVNGLVCHLEGQFGKTPPLMLLGYPRETQT